MRRDDCTMTNTYDDAIVIDGLNVSNWDSERALEGVYAGRVTAFNATIAIFEKFHEAMDNIAGWYERLDHWSDTLTAHHLGRRHPRGEAHGQERRRLRLAERLAD